MGEQYNEPRDPNSKTLKDGLTHIVLFKYKADLKWIELEKHFESFVALQKTSLHPKTGSPLIKSIKAGKNRSWEPFSKGMTHGFVLEFECQEDLDYYLLEEPVHRAFSKKASPMIEDSVVVDIKDGVLFGSPPLRPLLANEYRGSCHCGEIAWTVKMDAAEHVLCHCRTCQQLGGGPYSCNQVVPKENLSIATGEPKVYTYVGASGKPVRCYFCAKCTSHIYHHQDVTPDKIIVRTLLLADGPQMPATGEIYGDEKLSWVKELSMR